MTACLNRSVHSSIIGRVTRPSTFGTCRGGPVGTPMDPPAGRAGGAVWFSPPDEDVAQRPDPQPHDPGPHELLLADVYEPGARGDGDQRIIQRARVIGDDEIGRAG